MKTKDLVRVTSDVLRWRPEASCVGCEPGVCVTPDGVIVAQVAYGKSSLTADLDEPVDTDDLVFMMDEMARILVHSAAEFLGDPECDDILDEDDPWGGEDAEDS